MSIKQKEVRICDFCGGETEKDFFKLEAYPNEGPSTLYYKRKSYSFDDKDFCSVDCFFNEIKIAFGIK